MQYETHLLMLNFVLLLLYYKIICGEDKLIIISQFEF